MLRWAWLALVIGCGHPSTPVTTGTGSQSAVRADAAIPLDEDLPRLAERMLKLYKDWQQAFAEAGTDCALATTKLDVIVKANTDLLAAMRRVMRAGHAKIQALRKEREKYDAEIDASAKAIFESPTLAKCK